MDLVFPGILSLLKPPSPRLHRNWFHDGWQTGLQPHISPPETSYLEKVAFSGKEGSVCGIFPFLTSQASSFISAETGKILSVLILKQQEAADSASQIHLVGKYKSPSWR